MGLAQKEPKQTLIQNLFQSPANARTAAPPQQTNPPPTQVTTSGHLKPRETQPLKPHHPPPTTSPPAQTTTSYLHPNPQPTAATTHQTNDRQELRRRREPREQLEPKNNRRGAGDSVLTNDLGSQILSTSIRRIPKPPPCRPPPPPTFHGQSPAEKTRRAVKHSTPVQQRKTWWDPFYLDTSGRRRILAVRNFFTSAPLLLLLRSHCRISSTSPSLLQLRSLPLPLRLHCSSASKMPSYSSRTPLLLLRFITAASAACPAAAPHHHCCCSSASSSLHVAATPPHHIRNFTAAPLPPLPLLLQTPPIRTPTSNTPPHTIRWKAFTIRHRRSNPSVATSGFHNTTANDNTAAASPRYRSLTTPPLTTTDATQQQQPAVDKTKLSVEDWKSQTTSRSAGTTAFFKNHH